MLTLRSGQDIQINVLYTDELRTEFLVKIQKEGTINNVAVEEYVSKKMTRDKNYGSFTLKVQAERNKTSRETKGEGHRAGERMGLNYIAHREIQLSEN